MDDIEAIQAGLNKIAEISRKIIVLPPGRKSDPCPACDQNDLQPHGGKHRCPSCGYLQPCCQP
jgi:hypothetical protein